MPLFVAWRGRRSAAAAGLAFLAGVVYYAIVCSWIWYFGDVAIVPFSAAVAAYWAAAGAVVAWLRGCGGSRTRGSPPRSGCAPTRSSSRWPFGGFSWGEVGYAFHDVAPARAVASVGGVTFVTFLAVALNALLADLLVEPRPLRRVRCGRRPASR